MYTYIKYPGYTSNILYQLKKKKSSVFYFGIKETNIISPELNFANFCHCYPINTFLLRFVYLIKYWPKQVPIKKLIWALRKWLVLKLKFGVLELQKICQSMNHSSVYLLENIYKNSSLELLTWLFKTLNFTLNY